MFDLNAAIIGKTLPGLTPEDEARDSGTDAGGATSSSKSSAAAADAAHPSPREEEGESDEGESEGDEEEDSDDSDGVGAAQLQAELLEVVSLIQSNDESEEAIGELRFFARSRLGPQADNLHASWGASTVDEVPADRLRHLCWVLLQH